jgi:hypothetical protein
MEKRTDYKSLKTTLLGSGHWDSYSFSLHLLLLLHNGNNSVFLEDLPFDGDMCMEQ